MTRSKVTDAECQTPKENSTKVDWRKCMDENDITLDYVSWVYLLAGWQKSHERANGVRRKDNMLNFLNFFFSSIKYPLLFQNISLFLCRFKVQSRWPFLNNLYLFWLVGIWAMSVWKCSKILLKSWGGGNFSMSAFFFRTPLLRISAILSLNLLHLQIQVSQSKKIYC